MGILSGEHLARWQAYEKAIRRRVCSHCIDLGADGTCHSMDPDGCAIFRFVPELVALAGRIHAQRMGPYVKELRQTICAGCGNHHHDGNCEVRQQLDCGLDRYLALVLDAVDEVEQ